MLCKAHTLRCREPGSWQKPLLDVYLASECLYWCPKGFYSRRRREQKPKPLALQLPRNICCRNLITLTPTNAWTPCKSISEATDLLLSRGRTNLEISSSDSLAPCRHTSSCASAPCPRWQAITLLCSAYLLPLPGAGTLTACPAEPWGIIKKIINNNKSVYCCESTADLLAPCGRRHQLNHRR